MSEYSKTTRQQLDAYERTFSTTLNTNYKNAFIQCKKSNTNLLKFTEKLIRQLSVLFDYSLFLKFAENAVAKIY